MDTTTLSSKGQVILPKAVRDAHRWRPGTEFTVESTPEGVLLRPVKPLTSTRVEEVAGYLRYKGKPRTINEMDLAISGELRVRRDRGRY
jgi:AbrB family looped-hinge helix DNA binding protein